MEKTCHRVFRLLLSTDILPIVSILFHQLANDHQEIQVPPAL